LIRCPRARLYRGALVGEPKRQVRLTVLEAVGGSNYFDFEDQVNAALGELLTGKPTGVITFFDPAPATAPDAAIG
jgi:hypothetical protein